MDNIFNQVEAILGSPTDAIKYVNDSLGKSIKPNYWFRWRKGTQRAPLDVMKCLQSLVINHHYPDQASNILKLISEPEKE